MHLYKRFIITRIMEQENKTCKIDVNNAVLHKIPEAQADSKEFYNKTIDTIDDLDDPITELVKIIYNFRVAMGEALSNVAHEVKDENLSLDQLKDEDKAISLLARKAKTLNCISTMNNIIDTIEQLYWNGFKNIKSENNKNNFGYAINDALKDALEKISYQPPLIK